MSSFFAPSYLTYPLSCFLANDRPPDGAAEAACIAFVFLPSYIAELLAGYTLLELFWTEIAWKVAWGAGSLAFVSVLLPLIYIVFCCAGTWMPSKRFVFRPWIGPPRLELAAGICMEAAAAWDCTPAKDRRTSLAIVDGYLPSDCISYLTAASALAASSIFCRECIGCSWLGFPSKYIPFSS